MFLDKIFTQTPHGIYTAQTLSLNQSLNDAITLVFMTFLRWTQPIIQLVALKFLRKLVSIVT